MCVSVYILAPIAYCILTKNDVITAWMALKLPKSRRAGNFVQCDDSTAPAFR